MKKSQEITTQEIETSLTKIPAGAHEVRYFNQHLVERIEGMCETAAAAQMVAAVLQGKTPEEASLIAAQSIIPLTFHLGLLVGQELEASDAFTKMMMGGFDGPATDAGNTEHGDQ